MARPAGRSRTLSRTVPNAVSLLRVPLAVLFGLAGGTTSRLAIVAGAALTDLADGLIARRTGSTSRSGEVLDPIADRIFMATVFVTLAVERSIAAWTLPLLLLRDIGVTAGALVALVRDGVFRMPARAPGKRVTLLQLLAAGVLLLVPRAAPFVAVPIGLLGAIAVRDYVLAYRPAARPVSAATPDPENPPPRTRRPAQ